MQIRSRPAPSSYDHLTVNSKVELTALAVGISVDHLTREERADYRALIEADLQDLLSVRAHASHAMLDGQHYISIAINVPNGNTFQALVDLYAALPGLPR